MMKRKGRLISALALGSLLVVGSVLVYDTLFPCWCCQAPEDAARQLVSYSLRAPLEQYRIHMGRFPTTGEGLAALLHPPPEPDLRDQWKGPYIRELPIDPWETPYQYRSPSERNPVGYDLYSLGPDKKPSADDIGNW